MNGRAYDYNLGRFLSVDPIIQFPVNSQSLNPYSYILNNPMSGTDPSGYCASPVAEGGCTDLTEMPIDDVESLSVGNDGSLIIEKSSGETFIVTSHRAQISTTGTRLAQITGVNSAGNGHRVRTTTSTSPTDATDQDQSAPSYENFVDNLPTGRKDQSGNEYFDSLDDAVRKGIYNGRKTREQIKKSDYLEHIRRYSVGAYVRQDGDQFVAPQIGATNDTQLEFFNAAVGAGNPGAFFSGENWSYDFVAAVIIMVPEGYRSNSAFTRFSTRIGYKPIYVDVPSEGVVKRYQAARDSRHTCTVVAGDADDC